MPPLGLLGRHEPRCSQHGAGGRIGRIAARRGLRPGQLRRPDPLRRRHRGSRGHTAAMPQSSTSTSPNEPTITLEGLRSRWTTPWAWANPTVSQMRRKSRSSSRGRSRLGDPLQPLAAHQLHHVVEPAVRQGARVVHRHDARDAPAAPGCELPAGAEPPSRARSVRAGGP